MLLSRVVYTVRHETDIKIDERQMMTHRDIFIALRHELYVRVTYGVYRTSRDLYMYGHYITNCV